jgi:cleavage and polyadenylation specificity factor subunit 2
MMKLFGKAASEAVSLTPLTGACSTGPVCSLLEIGDFCLLLDCGSVSFKTDRTLKSRIEEIVSFKCKNLDAILISHADHYHIGALPCILGSKKNKKNLESEDNECFVGTRAICTLPVYKFGQMLLYDTFLNREMEGLIQPTMKDGSNPNILLEDLSYDLDDVDECMANVMVVKFAQTITLYSPDRTSSISLTARPSGISYSSVCFLVLISYYRVGRTIGGSIWTIQHGESTIVYAMDVNLKNESVIDGLGMEELAMTPTMLITDAGMSAVSGGKKKKEEGSVLIPTIMETVRGEGHVLLPCESAGRALELMQLLGTHWASKNLGMYNLVFLSPMAHNIMEFCKSQLEWMSDSLSRAFYNGKPNPFDLPYMKVFTSVKEMDKMCSGPKVVIATDSSLVCGSAKELLLKWGGDPRCRIIFTDSSDSSSLAHKLRTQMPPIFITVTKPLRIELMGEDLAAFRAEVGFSPHIQQVFTTLYNCSKPRNDVRLTKRP